MKTIKIEKDRFDYKFGNSFIEIEPSELRRVIKENPEILQEEKKHFVERMIGKECWFIDGCGEKHIMKWSNAIIDNEMLSINNAFFTESDCDKEIARRKALGNILSYIRDNEIELVKDEDWKDTEIIKYTIDGWDYEEDKIVYDFNRRFNYSQFSLAFYSQEDREKVISNCGKDLETLLKK